MVELARSDAVADAVQVGDLALEREVELVVRLRPGREDDGVDALDRLARARVEVEDRDRAAVDRARPRVEPVCEPLAEQAGVEMSHVERGQRGGKEGVPAADELDLGAAVEEDLADTGCGARPVVVEHDDPLPHRTGSEQDVPDGEHMLLVGPRQRLGERVDAREAGPAGHRARRDDDAVRRELADELGRRLRAEPYLDPEPAKAALEIGRDPAELLAARRPQDQVDLAAQLLLLLDERDVVAALGERRRGFHPRRAAAGDEPAGGRVGGRERREAPLAPGRGIDGAGDREALEDAADTALVAAYAMNDLVLPPLAGLVGELGVGDLRARHRDHVGFAGGDDLLGELRVLDPADGEDGQPYE